MMQACKGTGGDLRDSQQWHLFSFRMNLLNYARFGETRKGPRGLDHGFDYGNFESFDDILTASHNLSTVEMRNKLNEDQDFRSVHGIQMSTLRF